MKQIASPWISLAPPPKPTGEPTPARLFAQALADRMTPADVRYFDRALQNIEMGAERYLSSLTYEHAVRGEPGCPIAHAITGAVLIVYADAATRGGVGLTHISLNRFREVAAYARRFAAAQSSRELVDLAVSLLPCRRPTKGDGHQQVAGDIISFAALVATEADVSKLATIQGAIPALAIAVRTDTRGRPSLRTRHLVTAYPGDYLGTALVAGSA